METEKDYGDSGQGSRQIELQARVSLMMDRLNPLQRKIIKMIDSGYKTREIKKELRVSQKTIQETIRVVRDIL